MREFLNDGYGLSTFGLNRCLNDKISPFTVFYEDVFRASEVDGEVKLYQYLGLDLKHAH